MTVRKLEAGNAPSEISRYPTLDTDFQLDVAHHSSNTFHIQHTEISSPDVHHSNPIQRNPIKPFGSLLGPYTKLWDKCSSIASLKITKTSAVPKHRQPCWKNFSGACYCAGLNPITLRQVVASCLWIAEQGELLVSHNTASFSNRRSP